MSKGKHCLGLSNKNTHCPQPIQPGHSGALSLNRHLLLCWWWKRYHRTSISLHCALGILPPSRLFRSLSSLSLCRSLALSLSSYPFQEQQWPQQQRQPPSSSFTFSLLALLCLPQRPIIVCSIDLLEPVLLHLLLNVYSAPHQSPTTSTAEQQADGHKEYRSPTLFLSHPVLHYRIALSVYSVGITPPPPSFSVA